MTEPQAPDDDLGLVLGNPGPIVANPLPVGGRAALGATVGMAAVSIAAMAWSRLSYKQWDPNRLESGLMIQPRQARAVLAGAAAIGAAGGAALMARDGYKKAAAIGAVLGVAISQVPFFMDPGFPVRHKIIGNIWQIGLPIAGAVLGANAVKP